MDVKGNKRGAPQESEFVRQFKERPFIFVGTIFIFIIVVVAFVLVPAIVPESMQGGGDLRFGSYNKVPIAYAPGNYFAQAQENLARYLQSMINEENSSEVIYRIWREAFEETALHTAILDTMDESGYVPPDEKVDKEVAALPQFQENGSFSAARYRSLDNSARLKLWRDMRDSLVKERYLEDITALKASSQETDFVASMGAAQRSFDMVALPLTSYPDGEFIAFAEENPALFQTTHLYRISLASNEQEAQRVLDSVRNGELTFEEAAKTQSKDFYADRGGDMGLRLAYELNQEIPNQESREKVMALAAGEYSPVVEVPEGWGFFRSDIAPYPADVNDSVTLEKIRSYVRTFERGRMEDWLILEANEFIAEAAADGLDAAVLARGLEKRQFGPLPINYGNMDLFATLDEINNGLSGGASNDNFWRTAFLTPIGEAANPIVLGDNVVVLYPREEIPASPEAADSIKSRYSYYWLSYQTQQRLRSFILDSDKLDDNFMDTYIRIYSGS